MESKLTEWDLVVLQCASWLVGVDAGAAGATQEEETWEAPDWMDDDFAQHLEIAFWVLGPRSDYPPAEALEGMTRYAELLSLKLPPCMRVPRVRRTSCLQQQASEAEDF